ncbi:HlyD family secretion protein [Cloacibacterium sp.]|uniref:HlyD family secretion protein n=1 Tax=Cloacibacterium sp. TaxID=1913682 RepID=UPI0039E44CA5
MKKILILSILMISFISCKKTADYDASGTFEADEIMVTAEATGKILELKLEEGQQLTGNQQIGMIDGKGVELQKEQVLASINALDEKTNSANPQIQVLQSQIIGQKANISVLQEQLSTAIRERNRISNLVKSDAATKKQLDDANSQVAVVQNQIAVANAQLQTLNQQISATEEQIYIQNRAVLSEKNPNQKKVLQIDDQLKHNIITSPINGTVLTKYMYKGEFATVGKPIFKIANLDEMILRAYFTGDQLTKIKIGQNVKILVDAEDGKTKELNGAIDWISQKSEFTPKTIQTKDERANLVYAAKIRVKNDGFLKIGMYGEVKL